MTVFTEIEHYSWRGAFGGWVYRIFVNCCLDFLCARHRLREREVLTDVEVGSNTPTPNVEAVSTEELMHCISECDAKVYTKMNDGLQRGVGNPDLMVLFTGTMFHKMMRYALNETKK